MKTFLVFALIFLSAVTASASCICTKETQVIKEQDRCRGSMGEGTRCGEPTYRTVEYFVAAMRVNHRQYELSTFSTAEACKAFIASTPECN